MKNGNINRSSNVMVERHKVFISYYHFDDQYYKNKLVEMKYLNLEKWKYESIFDDYSVGYGDIDDTFMTPEQIRRKIRDEYIKDATVLVLLCGKNTKKRKHIDWESHAAMYDSEVNHQMGIIVINLPEIKQGSRASEDSEKNLIAPNANWCSLSKRAEFVFAYPYMPSRIIDNFVKNAPITVVDWNIISNNSNILLQLIDNAYNRRKYISYDHSTPLRKNNS